MIDFHTKITKWADERGLFDDPSVTPLAQYWKTMEEVMELGQAISQEDRDAVADAIGDVMVTLSIQATKWGLTLQDCAERAWDEIKDRKGRLVNGQFVKEA